MKSKKTISLILLILLILFLLLIQSFVLNFQKKTTKTQKQKKAQVMTFTTFSKEEIDKLNQLNKQTLKAEGEQKEKIEKELQEQLLKYNINSSIQKEIDSINRTAKTWTASYTELSFLTKDEFSKLNGLKLNSQNTTQNTQTIEINVKTPPTSFDWRDKKIMTSVKNQGLCGSCWAFSTLASLEAIVKRDLRATIDLSEQDLVSCCKNGKSNYCPNEKGCNGGSPIEALNYIKNKKIAIEDCFNYSAGLTGKEENCSNKGDDCKPQSWQQSAWDINNGYYYYTSNPDSIKEKLKKAIYNNGPVIGAMLAYSDLKHYSEGIYSHPGTEPQGVLNHGIVILGWGSQGGKDYWICKNSWGKNWGENGYFRIEQGECNIDKYFFAYPVDPIAPQNINPSPSPSPSPLTSFKQLLQNWGLSNSIDQDANGIINIIDFSILQNILN